MKLTSHADPRFRLPRRKRGSVAHTSGLCAYAIATFAIVLTGDGAHADPDISPSVTISARQINIVREVHDGNSLRNFRPLEGVVPAPFFEEPGSIRCRELSPKICRDLATTEFQLTSLRFMVPEVPGLAAKSLTIRRNSVIANYTFR